MLPYPHSRRLLGGSTLDSPNQRYCYIRFGAAQRIRPASENSTVKQRILSGPVSDPRTRARHNGTPRAETIIRVEIFFAGTRLRKYVLLLILIYLCDYCRILEESSSKRVTFNSLYLLNYFGMVTMKQKGGNCIRHAWRKIPLSYFDPRGLGPRLSAGLL